jgi:hypothetical protein
VGLQMPDLPDDQRREGCSPPTQQFEHRLSLDEIDFVKKLHKENNRKFFWTGRLAMRQTLFDRHPQKSGTLQLVTAVHRPPYLERDLRGHERRKYQPCSINQRRNIGVALVEKHDMTSTARTVAIHHGSESEETTSAMRPSVARSVDSGRASCFWGICL